MKILITRIFIIAQLSISMLMHGDANVIIELDKANIQAYFPSDITWKFSLLDKEKVVDSKTYQTHNVPESINLEHDTLLSTGGADSVQIDIGGIKFYLFNNIYAHWEFLTYNRSGLFNIIKEGSYSYIDDKNLDKDIAEHTSFKFNYNYYFKLYFKPEIKGFIFEYIKKERD